MESDAHLTQEQRTWQPSIFRRVLIFIRRFFVWFLIIVAALWSYGFYELGRAVVYQENPGLSGQQQATEILKNVGGLIQLPDNEVPTMATINDAASAKKSQPFLINAENGDVLLIYSNAQTAILYRPSENKLIAVGPITPVPAGQSAQQSGPVISNSSATSTTSKNETSNTQTKK